MVRMRFAAQALDELRKLDPKTPVTLRFIKQLMRTGAIPSVPVGNGNRRLLNFDALVAYLLMVRPGISGEPARRAGTAGCTGYSTH